MSDETRAALYRAMYGTDDVADDDQGAEAEIVAQQEREQQFVDVVSGGKTQAVVINGVRVLVPRAAYVEQLEKNIAAMGAKLEEQARAVRRLDSMLSALRRMLLNQTRETNRMERALGAIETEMDHKIDRRGA